MNKEMVKDVTHIYLLSYTEALRTSKNPNLAAQCAMAVTTIFVNRPQMQRGMNQMGMLLAAMAKELQKELDEQEEDSENK